MSTWLIACTTLNRAQAEPNQPNRDGVEGAEHILDRLINANKPQQPNSAGRRERPLSSSLVSLNPLQLLRIGGVGGDLLLLLRRGASAAPLDPPPPNARDAGAGAACARTDGGAGNASEKCGPFTRQRWAFYGAAQRWAFYGAAIGRVGPAGLGSWGNGPCKPLVSKLERAELEQLRPYIAKLETQRAASR